MDGAFSGPRGEQLRTAFMVAAWLFAALLCVSIAYIASSLSHMGEGIMPGKVIAVSGTGKAYAVPDTGEFTFSIVSDKTTVAAAQQDAAQKINTITQYLTGAGIDQKDIQTTAYSIYPQYEYQSGQCPQSQSGTPVYCPPSNQVLKGYEVSQTTDVKVQDVSKAGDLLTGVGSRGATEVSGLSFTVADPTAVQQQARDQAIADAKAKAVELAKALGVSLGRVVSFSENNGPMPVPLYGFASGASASNAATAPTISTGQNEVTSNVSVTYEIQ